MRHGRAAIGHTATPGGITVITADGELDYTTVPALEEIVFGNPPEANLYIVLDLARTSFLDSSGINALLRMNRAVTGVGGWFRLSGVAGPVTEVVELVGLDEVIPLYATVDLALRA